MWFEFDVCVCVGDNEYKQANKSGLLWEQWRSPCSQPLRSSVLAQEEPKLTHISSLSGVRTLKLFPASSADSNVMLIFRVACFPPWVHLPRRTQQETFALGRDRWCGIWEEVAHAEQVLSTCLFVFPVFMANFLPVRATGNRRCGSGVVASNPLHGACHPFFSISSLLPGMPW